MSDYTSGSLSSGGEKGEKGEGDGWFLVHNYNFLILPFMIFL